MELAEMEESAENVKLKLSSGVYIAKEKSGTSLAWKRFKEIYTGDGKTKLKFAQCKECDKVLTHNTSSTSSLIRHKCSAPRATNRTSDINRVDKDSVTKNCVLMCASDIRPFEIVAGQGFRILAQNLVQIGSKYGNIDVDQVLPDPRTISRNVHDTAKLVREEIFPCVCEKANKGWLACTTDMWSDHYKNTSYTTVTSHYISDNWIFNSMVLFTAKFPDENKTAENLKREIENRIISTGLPSESLAKIKFVSDQGSNIKKALKDYQWLPCAAHILNTVLRNTFKDDFLKENLPTVWNSITACKETTAYMKRTGLVNQLSKSLQQECDVRWNSRLSNLESVHQQDDEIKSVLLQHNASCKIEKYDRNLVGELIAFLGPFKEGTEKLEADEPTIQLVLLWKLELINHCSPSEEDSEEIKALKQRAAAYIEEKLILQPLHFIATFLWPAFKHLTMIGANERERVYSDVRTRCSAYREFSAREVKAPSPHKYGRFSQWRTGGSSVDEVSLYLATSFGDCDDILKWWKDHAETFPLLSTLAREVLCIPATSAHCERNFSLAGLVITNRRTNISPQNVNDLLVINNYMRQAERSLF